MKRFKIPRKLISIFICLAMLMSYLPATLSAASMAASTITGSVTDPGTADAWESMMGTDTDGNRYAGRVWADKSVYMNGQTVTLNSRGEYNSSFKVSLEEDEAFQIIFSALGSSMTTTTKTSTTGPVDVVLILDTSTSMDDTSGGVTRLQRVIEAANKLIEDLLTIKNVRIAIVTYNYDSETVIPLDFYTNGLKLVVNNYFNNNKAKVEEKYGREQRVYSISVDLPANSEAHALMNPGALVNGFNSGNSHDSISEAYEKYLQWAEGDTVTITAGGGWYGGGEQWRFDHNYPTLGGAITDQDIINNINYVSPNSFYDVTSTESSGGSGVADLSDAFEQIYQELSSGVFNPITDSSTVDGSIGVDNTPLIYVDYIGRYMEIKEITHVTVFGASYGVVNNGDGTYTVAAATGTNATITETDPGANFSITYRTRNHSGENADADNAVVIPADGNATAVIINDYTPLSTTVDMDVRITKNFTMEGSHSGGSFTFKVQSWNGTEWIDLPGKSAVTVYEANTSGTKVVDIEDVLDGVLFTEVGSWAYQILEVKGAVENVTYDRTLYTFTVKVTDNNGQLTATITDVNNEIIDEGIYEVTFNNTYHTAPVSIDIIKTVENNSGDSSVSKAGFDFTAIRTDANWVPLTGADASQMSVYTDAAGEARFTATYKAAGTYYYVITEVDENVPGWTYSDAAYLVTVVVVEDNGDLVATLSIEKTGSDNPDEIAQVDAAHTLQNT